MRGTALRDVKLPVCRRWNGLQLALAGRRNHDRKSSLRERVGFAFVGVREPANLVRLQLDDLCTKRLCARQHHTSVLQCKRIRRDEYAPRPPQFSFGLRLCDARIFNQHIHAE